MERGTAQADETRADHFRRSLLVLVGCVPRAPPGDDEEGRWFATTVYRDSIRSMRLEDGRVTTGLPPPPRQWRQWFFYLYSPGLVFFIPSHTIHASSHSARREVHGGIRELAATSEWIKR